MYRLFILVSLFLAFNTYGQVNQSKQIIGSDDFQFLESMTKDVLESSRIYPGQKVSVEFGGNSTGGTLIRPGGRDCYPSFWIRDYAMSLESELVPADEQKHMLMLTASTQCDQTWIGTGGSMIPYGSVADHIRIDDGLPVYFPGTYDFNFQGDTRFGVVPPYSDQFFFIHMAYSYLKVTSNIDFVFTKVNGIPLIERLEIAFNVPPVRNNSNIVYTTEKLRGVDFGFRDVITITGDLCLPSIFKFRASNELAWIFEKAGNSKKAQHYRKIAADLKQSIPASFYDNNGLLKASNGKSNQPDVWSTALAIYFNILERDQLEKSSKVLADSYLKGTLSYKGNIRHIRTTDDYNDSTSWELSYAKKNTYQNGAYWGTPTGWVVYAIAKTNPGAAKKLAGEYIQELRENDYRKGDDYGSPYECFHPSGHKQNPVYLTSVSCPYAAFKRLMNNE